MTNTRMDKWGFQGITILSEILGILLLRELLRDLENLNGVPLLQGSLYTMGNNNFFFFMEPLRDLGKSQWSCFTWGGLQGNHCEIWENLNGVPLLQGSLYTIGNNNIFLMEPLRDLGKSQWSSFTWGG